MANRVFSSSMRRMSLTLGLGLALLWVLGGMFITTTAVQAQPIDSTRSLSPSATGPTIITTVTVGAGPRFVAINQVTNRIYVANSSSQDVSVIDGASNTVVATIPLGADLLSVAVNPNTNRIYVTNSSSDKVSVIDGSNNTVEATVTVGFLSPFGIAVNPNTNRIYVPNNYADTVLVIDGTTNTVVATVTVGSAPFGIAVDPTTNRIYVANRDSHNVSMIDGTNNSVIATVMVGAEDFAFGIGVNPVTKRVYVGTSNGLGSRPCNELARDNVLFSKRSCQQEITRLRTQVTSGNAVSVINATDNSVITSMAMPGIPWGIGVNSNINRIYATIPFSDEVSVIDGESHTVVAMVPAGSAPLGVGVSPNTNRVYVANYYSNTVSVIQDATGLWYVAPPPLGNDVNNCTSPAVPCATLGAAIDKASAGETIYIAAGTFTENVTVTVPLNFIGAGASSTIVDGNHAGRVFNIINGAVSISGLTVQNGSIAGDGGGIYTAGSLTLSHVTVMSNTASNNGGGIFNAGTLHTQDSLIHYNAANNSGCGLYNVGAAELSSTPVRNNYEASPIGGGIYNSGSLRIISSTVAYNSGMAYGNIWNNGGTLYLVKSSVSNGSSTTPGNALANTNGGQAFVIDSQIFNNPDAIVTSGSTLVITNSVIMSNVTAYSGGGINAYNSTVIITNSTLSGNSANTGRGGGMSIDSSTVNLDNVTIANNTAAYYSGGGSGGGLYIASGTVNARNTIIAGNHDAGADAHHPDCSGVLTSQGYNLVGDIVGCTISGTLTGVITNTAPLLGDLQDNGGATWTMALLPGSLAIDVADDATCPHTDQRGVSRPQGPHCDLGAYEREPPNLSPIWYVALPPLGDDAHTCASLATPCATVQHAVDLANSGDEIRVAAGIYTDVSVRPRNDITTTGVVTQMVYVSKTVTLRGGFATTNWITPDPSANPTVLDAQGQGRVFYITGNISPTLEGLRLTHGLASAAMDYSDCTDWWTCEVVGSGIYARAAALTLSHSQLDNNYFSRFDSGTLYASGGRVTLTNNAVINNFNAGITLVGSSGLISGNVIVSNTTQEGGGNGGGLLLQSSVVTVVNNLIVSNTASYVCGGGVCIAHSNAVLDGNLIRGNRILNGQGGGVDVFVSTATLKNNLIEDNQAGTFYIDGGGVAVEFRSQADLIDNVIRRNSSLGQGGGVVVYANSHAKLQGNMIVNNVSSQGGGVSVDRLSSATLINNLVAHNPSASQLYVGGSQVDLLHTTLVDGNSTGLYVTSYQDQVTSPTFSTVAMTNTLIASHTVGINVSQGNTLTLNSLLWHGTPITVSQTGTATLFVQNELYGDPRFVDPAHDDYHLASGSAALDHGIDAGIYTDLDGNLRPQGAGFDIGAYERVIYHTFLPLLRR